MGQKEIHDSCFCPHLPVHFSPLIFPLLLWKLHHRPVPNQRSLFPWKLCHGHSPALGSTPKPKPSLSLCAWCSLLPDFSAPMGSTRAVSSLPAAGTCLAPKSSCNGFEPTEMPLAQVPGKGGAAATLCDAVLAQTDTGEVSTAPRSWPSLPAPSRNHLQRSRNKGSC